MVHLSMEVSDMKKFLINLLLFFVIVVIIDILAGKLFWSLHSHVTGGRTGIEFYACERSNEDIIILGSSRASHHYIPQIITDSTGLSCFNAGQDGNGIILQYGRWKMMSKRHIPKVIIYDINPGFDLEYNDNMIYIDRLKPFCRDKDVRDYLVNLYPLEGIKMLSCMYCYNFKFLEIISDYILSHEDNKKGYIPFFGEIRKDVVEKTRNRKIIEILTYDNEKLKYLEALVKECSEKGTKIVFVASPSFLGGEFKKNIFEPVRQISNKYNVPFLYYYASDLSFDESLFKDSGHMNDEGAKAFTKEISRVLEI